LYGEKQSLIFPSLVVQQHVVMINLVKEDLFS